MFVVKRGEYFRKYDIFEVDFDSGICISMGCIHKKEYMTSHPSFLLQISIFVQKSLKMGQNGPLYREICQIYFWLLKHFLKLANFQNVYSGSVLSQRFIRSFVSM